MPRIVMSHFCLQLYCADTERVGSNYITLILSSVAKSPEASTRLELVVDL
jgi:hypothetical protein